MSMDRDRQKSNLSKWLIGPPKSMNVHSLGHQDRAEGEIGGSDMRERVLGTLTIGQAPRPDVVPIIDRHVAAEIRRIHRGVLDGLSHAEIAARYQPEGGEPELVTRLQDGTEIVLSRQRMKDGVQQTLRTLEAEGCDAMLPLGLPVILSNAVAAKALSELLGG